MKINNWLVVFILCMNLGSSLAIAQPSSRELAERAYLQAHDDSPQLHKFYSDPNWHLVEQQTLEEARNQVPSQTLGRLSLRTWSCGPNSVARAFCIIGVDLCPKDLCADEAYEDVFETFAHSFPKGLGAPTTSSGTFLAGGLMAMGFVGAGQGPRQAPYLFAASLVSFLAGISPYLLTYLGLNAGAPPQWIVNHLAEDSRFSQAHPKLFATDSFDDLKQYLQISVGSQKRPVIALVIFDALAWHYVTIVGYNDLGQEFLVLDTDKSIFKISYANMALLMNTGLLPDDTYSTYLIVSRLGSLLSLNVFNAISFALDTPSEEP